MDKNFTIKAPEKDKYICGYCKKETENSYWHLPITFSGCSERFCCEACLWRYLAREEAKKVLDEHLKEVKEHG